MSFVKLKKKAKRRPNDEQVTLGAKHEQIMDAFEQEKKRIPRKTRQINNLNRELDRLNKNLNATYSEIRHKLKLQDDITELENELLCARDGHGEVDYFQKTTDILIDYYDDDENLPPVDLEECSFFPPEKIGITNFVSREQKNNKGHLLDSYLVEVDPDYIAKGQLYANTRICEICSQEKMISHSEGSAICITCGNAQPILIASEKPGYKEPVPENSYFAYKRINHFKEWLAQFQAKETTEVPQHVYDLILIELKKSRVQNLATLKPETIRGYLKKLRLNKYYEHIPQIINKLNRLPPPIISREIEEKLCSMFHEIQKPFKECCPSNRKNFLSYSYVLHKMTVLLGLDEFKTCFNLLKSREKLKQQDIIWRCICHNLSWDFQASL